MEASAPLKLTVQPLTTPSFGVIVAIRKIPSSTNSSSELTVGATSEGVGGGEGAGGGSGAGSGKGSKSSSVGGGSLGGKPTSGGASGVVEDCERAPASDFGTKVSCFKVGKRHTPKTEAVSPLFEKTERIYSVSGVRLSNRSTVFLFSIFPAFTVAPFVSRR